MKKNIHFRFLLLILLILTRNSFAQDGQLDPAFGNGGIVTTPVNVTGSGSINSLVLQTDGKIVAAGYFDEGTKTAFAVTRYNTDGSLDKTFGVDGYAIISAFADPNEQISHFYSKASSVQILPGNQGIVAGGYTVVNGHRVFALVYLNPDGTPNINFGQNGFTNYLLIGSFDAEINSIVQSDGKVVAAGYADEGTGGSVKTFAVTNGVKIDTNRIGGSLFNEATTINIQSDPANEASEKIVAAGYYYNGHNYDFALVRYKSDLTIDSTFGSDINGIVTTAVGTGHDYLTSIAIQKDGKIIAGGYSDYGGNQVFALVRYKQNGIVDSSFGTKGTVITQIGQYAYLKSVGIEEDGKIIAAGYSNDGSGPSFAVACYNQDGSLDSNFGVDGITVTKVGSSSSAANAMVIQNDGKVILGGYFANKDESDYDFAMVRYNQDGSLDNTFGRGSTVLTPIGVSYAVNTSMAIQKDGKIITAGYSSGANTSFSLVRYNHDGSLDYSFNKDGTVITSISGHDDKINSIVIKDNGKIVAGGYSSDSLSRTALTQYNNDGSLDTTFGEKGVVITPVTDYGSFINSLAIESSGIIIGAGGAGKFPSSKAMLISYDSSGNLNSNFGISGVLIFDDFREFNKLVIQRDGKFVVAAVMPQGLSLYSALVRFKSDGTVDSSFGINGRIVNKTGLHDEINSFFIQKDGKILTTVTITDSSHNQTFYLKRYTINGKLDSTFSGGSKLLPYAVNLVNEQSDSKIITADFRNEHQFETGRINLTRYNSNGKVDKTFGTEGSSEIQINVGFQWGGYTAPIYSLSDDYLSSIAIQDDGKIIISGFAKYHNNSNGYSYNDNTYYNKTYSSIFFLTRYNNSIATDINEKNNGGLPTVFKLEQNYPNPFNPSTSIRYTIRSRQFVSLKIYDIVGREVATLVNEEKRAGNYKVTFDASSLSSGIYFYRLQAGDFHQVKKLVLLK